MNTRFFERGNTMLRQESQWNQADSTMNTVVKCRKAVTAIAPYGDHLLSWLISEVNAYSPVDDQWILGVLKGAVADQYPDLPIVWLDERLPTRTYGEDG